MKPGTVGPGGAVVDWPLEGSQGLGVKFERSAMLALCLLASAGTARSAEPVPPTPDLPANETLAMALMEAVADACANGTPTLVIERGQNGRSLQVHAVQ